MYNHFFGFRERPFKLVPDPDYLFLSQSHEEALAHLRYAVKDGEGFVEIIGEIGTGKTLLCRTFLESLGDDVESAYVFNPRMDALDLLKTVCDKFGIPSSSHASIKALIDALNVFLIEKKAAGKKVVLVIDEAQNLSRDVLEQIRLLSNLETTKDKLLQIILAGQPELGIILDAWELRQLRQRISLRCRLNPLSPAETRRYITHRIQVASEADQASAQVFSRRAARRIYQFSKGIPRLINMACDRALLAAYTRNRRTVSSAVAASAIRELAAPTDARRHFPAKTVGSLMALSVLCAVVIIGLVYFRDGFPVTPRKPDVNAHAPAMETQKSEDFLEEKTPGTDSSDPVAAPSGEIKSHSESMDFLKFIADNPGAFSKTASFEKLLKIWGRESQLLPDSSEMTDDPDFFSRAARPNSLTLTLVDGDMERIVRLNLPAILKFILPSGGGPIYMTAVQATPDAMVFSGPQEQPVVAVPYDQVMAHWTGEGYVFWKNFYHYQGIIPLSSPGEAVITLKLHLRDMGYSHIGISATYDLDTRMAIKAIQARHGIPVDGYVGPLTQIVLYNETPSLTVPHLWEPMRIPDEIFRKKIVQTGPVQQNQEPPADPMESRP